MRKLLIAAVALTGTAMPASAFAGGTYYIRNETQRPLTCGIRRPRSEVTVPVALRPGGQSRPFPPASALGSVPSIVSPGLPDGRASHSARGDAQ